MHLKGTRKKSLEFSKALRPALARTLFQSAVNFFILTKGMSTLTRSTAPHWSSLVLSHHFVPKRGVILGFYRVYVHVWSISHAFEFMNLLVKRFSSPLSVHCPDQSPSLLTTPGLFQTLQLPLLDFSSSQSISCHIFFSSTFEFKSVLVLASFCVRMCAGDSSHKRYMKVS